MAELRNIADKELDSNKFTETIRNPCFLYALSFLTSRREAEDVIQEVFC